MGLERRGMERIGMALLSAVAEMRRWNFQRTGWEGMGLEGRGMERTGSNQSPLGKLSGLFLQSPLIAKLRCGCGMCRHHAEHVRRHRHCRD